ncbi:pyrroline-5-carboxylate reductase dimerization-domain-containing protein [Dactylonectria macrodidyma]|uniref:Pyrroline-5-carboxylate reductase n=1 Tax=Dactylonectria macrodidyma TaxID=307937 RepID=A0A9P9INT3_9HYPO|nr:pyrroline-5-carboxylate reductase dimerization-domain-containing protein [Dactylonectria macrodidyma]
MTPSLQDAQISFVGGGNMASAIIGGLLAKNISKQHIFVAEPWDVNRDKMAALGVRTTADNVEASRDADIVIIAVKPQVAQVACTELGAAWADRENLPVVISIAAGITVASYVEWFTQGASGRTPPIVRVMPNTPALVGEGASGLFANEGVSSDEKELATALLASVSRAAEWVDKESLLDVVTGISGSGPAYFFAFVEHLITAGTSLGLSEEQATRLAKQTALGAGKMLVESSEEPAQLRKNVTSPNGTTHAALVSFEKDGLKDIVGRAVKAATDRAEELGRA